MCAICTPLLLDPASASATEELPETRSQRNQPAPDSAPRSLPSQDFPGALFQLHGHYLDFPVLFFSMFLQTPGFFKLFPPPKNLTITVDIFPLILQGLDRNNSPFVLPPCLDADLSRLGAELSWSQLWALFQARKRELFPSGLFPVPGGSWGWEIRNYLPQDSHPTSSGRGETCLDPGIRSRLGAPGLGSVAEIEFLCALRDFVAILG